MAIIERKQLTGSTAKINQYAGHEGQLVFDKQTKHLHVLSGTAGQSTKLANVSDIPAPVDVSGKADKTYVDQQLAKKQPTGDYATNTQLTQGLAGKAPSSHTHTKSQITDFPEIPDTSGLIPKSGDRGKLGGHETASAPTTINASSPDSMTTGIGGALLSLTVEDGATNQSYTKVVYLTQVMPTVNLGSKWVWAGGKAPELKAPGIIVFHWNNNGGIANFVAGVA